MLVPESKGSPCCCLVVRDHDAAVARAHRRTRANSLPYEMDFELDFCIFALVSLSDTFVV